MIILSNFPINRTYQDDPLEARLAFQDRFLSIDFMHADMFGARYDGVHSNWFQGDFEWFNFGKRHEKDPLNYEDCFAVISPPCDTP